MLDFDFKCYQMNNYILRSISNEKINAGNKFVGYVLSYF